jgi:hypothetical protein
MKSMYPQWRQCSKLAPREFAFFVEWHSLAKPLNLLPEFCVLLFAISARQ